ncbi:metal-dependent transcriptional regulator [Chloroflexota bacterium]
MVTGQTASMEDYLEAIAWLRKERRVVRVSHISRALGVTMPSVTLALKRLMADGLVEHERYGHVELTAEGDRIGEDVIRRHEALRQFLSEILGVDPDTAIEDACKMEHSLSPSSRDRLSRFVEFVLSNQRGQPEWLRNFNYYFEHGEPPEECLGKYYRDD